MSDITPVNRVGVLPLVNNSMSSVTTSSSIQTLTDLDQTSTLASTSAAISMPIPILNSDIAPAAQQKYFIYTDDAAPINKLINELSELKTAVTDIKNKMTSVSIPTPVPVSIDNLINLSDESSSTQSALKQVEPTHRGIEILPSPHLSRVSPPPLIPLRSATQVQSNINIRPSLNILPNRVVPTNTTRLRRSASLAEVLVGVALIGLLGASVLSLSIIDEVLAEYCVIGTYAFNKFYIMYVSNSMPKYTKWVFMFMAASLLVESTFLITSLFRLLDKPSHVYSSIAALIDVCMSWALTQL